MSLFRQFNCQHPDCKHPARVMPRLHLPPADGALTMQRAAVLNTEIMLCEEHGATITTGQLLTDEAKAMFDAGAGEVVIDYTRAWVSTVKLYGPEFTAYLDTKEPG